MKGTAIKQKLAKEITDSFARKNKDTAAYNQFVSLFLERFPTDYLQKLSPDDVSGYINYIWKNFENRSSLAPVVDATEGVISLHRTGRLFLCLINDDRPYIIDSLQSILNKWNIKPQLLVHPVINVHRSKDGRVEKVYRSRARIQETGTSVRQESVIFVQAKNRLSPEQMTKIRLELTETLSQLKWVLDDQDEMRAGINHLRDHLLGAKSERWSGEEIEETRSFLDWLKGKYFVFLGSRYFSAEASPEKTPFFCLEEKMDSRLGLLRDPDFCSGDDFIPSLSRAKLIAGSPSSVHDRLPLVTVVKTNKRSTVLRPSRTETIEILDWSTDGQIKGVYQFVGLFTKEIFNTSSFDIPLLRDKTRSVFDKFDLDPSWYDGKSLISILDSIPRDEMFYHDESELYDICERVLQLRDDTGLTTVLRRDVYGRYVTIMVFLTRERFGQKLKDRIGEILSHNIGGRVASSVAQLGDLPFARIIYVIEFDTPNNTPINLKKLEQVLDKESLSWLDRLERYIDQETGEEDTIEIISSYKNSFPLTYQEQFGPAESYDDIVYIRELTRKNSVDLNIYEREDKSVKVKIYHLGHALSLSDLLPVLANMGLKVLSETTYAVQRGEDLVNIHDFDVEVTPNVDWHAHENFIRIAFREVWQHQVENDGFNQLILLAGLTDRQVTVLRAYSKFLLQAQLSFSQGYIEQTLAHYPKICRELIHLFELKFCPKDANPQKLEAIGNKIEHMLQDVTRLDHDRIIRRLLNAIQSSIRTNYYQHDKKGHSKEYISFKFDCSKLDDLPQPRPLYEIYVYAPHMEGIHLRGGKVARGGIRWSDRFEDYRTEVLSLMKAQMVKNSVIVPLGSKGGFVVKRSNGFTDRNALMDEVIRCYQTLIRGMLDITDNLVNGKVSPPKDVVRYDDDDPYLVVAADKGTATFSDIANGISQEYGFWLDDAFASGGSAGYDHKKMAITSRGAWESVKRHFREMGHNVQETPFTVVGVGDMSGDVFGNGMLRSDKTKLIAAFDHRHIFIDPTPDPEASFQERKRVFDLPRSSWMDYNPKLISKGGGIFARTEKRIKLSEEAKTALGLTRAENTPDEIMRAILQAPVDLLWFGGIGTYVKSSQESNADVGDLGNVGIRIDGRMIGARVVGEGANLGMTQLGRIECALNGVRINTDAIDNSAGVDCSDHEVNIKILFSTLKEKIERSKRDKILREMTDEVGHQVLEDNYRQTQILSILETHSKEELSSYQNLIKILEAEIHLSRELEYLPDDETFERRGAKGQGLTRPELSVLLAYSKISLYNKILASNLVDQNFYHQNLANYFPTPLQKTFYDDILQHPLHREIIATVLANKMINKVGPTFVYEMCQTSGCSTSEVAHAFFTAVKVMEMDRLWDEIDKLDDRMQTQIQIDAYRQITQILKTVILRLISHSHAALHKTEIHKVISCLPTLIEGENQIQLGQKIINLHEKGIPGHAAEKLAIIPYLDSAIDIASSIHNPKEIMSIAEVYFAVRSNFGLDWIQDKARHLDLESDWERTAQLGLLDDIGQTAIALTLQAITAGYLHDIRSWLETQEGFLRQTQNILSPLKASGRVDVGMLSFAVRQLQRMPQLKALLVNQ